jgi:SSS family solute:Na+ symporter
LDTYRISTVDVLVILAYLLGLIYAGISINRRRASEEPKTSEELFLSGRSLPWYKVGLSIFSTNVSPSMLVAYFGAAYTSGMVLANFEWMAWIFLLLLSFIFIPHYLRTRISTMPEFLLNRFGKGAHGFFTYFSMFSSLVTWSGFMLCIGGIVIHQLTGIPVYISVGVVVLIALSYSATGGMTSIVHTGVIQSVTLIGVSILILVLAVFRIGDLSEGLSTVPSEYWKIFRPSNDDTYPWHAILLGYPVIGIWFWCTEQSVVQRTLAARSIRDGQLGAWLVAALKVIMPFLFILPGILCLVLVNKGMFQPLKSPDQAYVQMVFGLLPRGLIGLALATLMVSVINDVATGLSSFSTVFTMDVYARRATSGESDQRIRRIGILATLVAGFFAAIFGVFFSMSGKGLFELGQSLGTYMAPPISTVFILGILWKKATPRAAVLTLYIGTVVCLGIGFCQLMDFPNKSFWPHFMLLCFYLMAVLVVFMVLVSLLTQPKKEPVSQAPVLTSEDYSGASTSIKVLWLALAIVMFLIYYFFA